MSHFFSCIYPSIHIFCINVIFFHGSTEWIRTVWLDQSPSRTTLTRVCSTNPELLQPRRQWSPPNVLYYKIMLLSCDDWGVATVRKALRCGDEGGYTYNRRYYYHCFFLFVCFVYCTSKSYFFFLIIINLRLGKYSFLTVRATKHWQRQGRWRLWHLVTDTQGRGKCRRSYGKNGN